MIGVILWSNAAKEKAIIWCEDHGALAYLQGREHLDVPTGWPEAGDLVELDFEAVGELRHARNVMMVSGKQKSELPGMLRDMGQNSPAAARPKAARPELRLVADSDRLRRARQLAATG